MLNLIDVSHSFTARRENFDHGMHHVLKDVSFSVRRGEVLGVVGKNGVGKTTLLRLMAGILKPTNGIIQRFPGATYALLSLGLGFQPHLSGRDNARLSSMLQGCSAARAKAALGEILEFSELGRSFDEPVKTYSAGMRARLGFATAMFTEVDTLLIDEVLAVGDVQFRKKARKAMLDKVAGEQTVVLVSHAEAQIKQICHRAVLLDAGSLVMDDSPEAVFREYSRTVNIPKG